MATAIQIRFYHPDDLAQATALGAKVKPYRQEDQAEVEAMYGRAQKAREIGDRWIPQTPSPLALEQASDIYLALWVAVLPLNNGKDQVVGMAGVDRVGAALEMPSNMPLAQE